MQQIHCAIKQEKQNRHQEIERTIAQLREGRFGNLAQLDDRYRQMFMAWAGRRFKTTPNDLEDAWQEALTHFYEQVVSGKLTTLSCSIHTYLFAVGGNFLLNLNRKMRRVLWQDEADHALQGRLQLGYPLPDYAWEDEKEILLKALDLLSEKCRNLLISRHYHGYAIPEIKEMYQFASENATSVHLSNCLASLKTTVQKNFPADGK